MNKENLTVSQDKNILKFSKQLKAKAQVLEASIQIGKNGLTEAIIKEISKILKKRKLVKIKLLHSFSENKDKKKVALELAAKTKSKLVQIIGFVVVLYKR